MSPIAALLGTQRGLAEVAEVGDAEPVQLEDEDRVRAAFGAGRPSCSEAIATTSPIGDSSRPAVERSTAGSPEIDLDAVVVEVLVGDQQQVDPGRLDRRVVELHTAVRQHRHVGERVDEDLRLARRSGGRPTGRATQLACCSSSLGDLRSRAVRASRAGRSPRHGGSGRRAGAKPRRR